jgi:hypothetical protein
MPLRPLPRWFVLPLILASVGTYAADHPLTGVGERTCLSCHGPQKKKGGLRVDQVVWPAKTAEQAEVWRKIADTLHAGEMPPPDAKVQLEASERHRVIAAIDKGLGSVTGLAGAHDDDVLRRLNRTQYQNTLRDLLGIHANLADRLPEDATAHGFDRVGSALSLSGELLGTYMGVAEYALLDAMPPMVERPATTTVTATLRVTEGEKNNRPRKDVRVLDDDGVVAFRGGLALQGVKIPLTARYRIRVTVATYQAKADQPLHVELRTGDDRIAYLEARTEPTTTTVEAVLAPGNDISLAPLLDYPKRPWRHDYQGYDGPGVLIRKIEVEGPLIDVWPPRGVTTLFGNLALKKRDGNGRVFADAAPAGRDRTTTTVTSTDARADATRLMQAFLPRAFRRPVTDAEVTGFVAVAMNELATPAKPSFHQAMNLAYTAVLCAPDFLFLQEKPGKLDDYAIASRLSYFLSGSMPDDALMAAAAAGKLRQSSERVAQAKRLLASPAANEFVRDFTSQWLDLKNLEATSPDTKLYPEFDPALLDAMRQETELFVGHVLAEDLSVMEFVDSSWSFLNGRLAKHYGIAGVSGSMLRKVTLPPDCHRGGVITHASVLKVSANGTATSPVVRGKFMLERIIGRHPSPPPPDIPAIEADVRGATTIREQLAKHREDASCASCHQKLDPHGFALENFDVVGGWRTTYRVINKDGKKVPGVDYRIGPPVESGDELPGGRRFTVIDEYQALLQSERDQIARAMVERLYVYALGRGTTFADRPLIDGILSQTRAGGYGFRALILALIASDRFAVK